MQIAVYLGYKSHKYSWKDLIQLSKFWIHLFYDSLNVKGDRT